MKSRLDDLVATADRQLASRSYDAAVDTFRMALGEPGAAEAGVGERLEAACQARDAARGFVRPVEAPAPPKVEMAAPPVETPAEPRVEREPALPAEPQVKHEPALPGVLRIDSEPAPAEPGMDLEPAPPEPGMDLEPAPALQAAADCRPIEAPSFHLMEDDPSMLERVDRERRPPLEVEKLSILDPTPLPEMPGEPHFAARIILALGIFLVVCGLAFLLK